MQNNPPISERAEIPPLASATNQPGVEASLSEKKSGKWIPFVYLAGGLIEIAAMLMMTWMRYSNQGLPAHFLALTKTANLLGFMIAIPFITAFGAAIFLPRLHRIAPAITSLALSGVGLGLLISLQFLEVTHRPLVAVIYLAFKAIVLMILVVTFSPTVRSLWRKIVYVAIFSLLLTVVSYIIVIATVLLDPITPPPTDVRPRAEYDAGVILGAAVWSGNKPSPVFRERIKKGYELLKNGVVEFIVLTGGNAPHELAEAEVAKRELLKIGADPTRIVLEAHTSSTVEQILFIRDELTKQGWTSFVIISDQFHLKRALEICAFNDIEANGISSESPLGPRNLAIYHIRESAALILYWLFGL